MRTDNIPLFDAYRREELTRVLGEEAVSRATDEYFGAAPERLAELHRAIRDSDRVALRRCAHTLLGASALVGVPAIEHLAHRLLDAAIRDDEAAARDVAAHLYARFATAMAGAGAGAGSNW